MSFEDIKNIILNPMKISRILLELQYNNTKCVHLLKQICIGFWKNLTKFIDYFKTQKLLSGKIIIIYCTLMNKLEKITSFK